MKSILGIDLGTSSLGYAVITSLDGKNPKILSGVDIFPAAKSNLGSGNKEESNNASRRMQRQMRRQYARKRLRKQHLLDLLIQFNMCPLSIEELDCWRKWDKERKSSSQKFPDSAGFREWLKINPYELRTKGLEANSLTRYEFGRILYSMIQRRGFLSSRKSSDEGAMYEGGNGIKGITETDEKLKGKTLGEYLYEVSAKDGEPFSQEAERLRARYTLRDMYIHEFEKIWNAQASFLGLDELIVTLRRKRIIRGNPDNKENKKRLSKLQEKFGRVVITTERSSVDNKDYYYFEYTEERPFKEHLAGIIRYDEEGKLRYRSNESVLFWQRPLRSQKGLLDRCSYEGNRFYSKKENRWIVSGPRVIPSSHPLFEVFCAMQQVMNIKLNDQELPKLYYTEIFRHLMLSTTKKSIKLSDIKKKFKTLVGRFNFDDDYAFTTCPTIAHISSLIKESKSSAIQLSDDIAFPIPFNMELYVKIWHKLYNFDDNAQLAESLCKMEGVVFKDNLEELLKDVKLEEGYGNVSYHALENIVPFMQQGIPQYESVLLGGISNAVRYANKGKVELPSEVLDFVLNVLPNKKYKEGETLQAIIDYMLSDDFPLPTPDARKLRYLLYHPSQPTIEHQIQKALPRVENLRNPLVEQSLWALRRRVNALLKEYRKTYGEEFRFDEIHIELARDLKTGVKGRQAALRRQRDNEEENNEAREIIRGYGLAPTRDNLLKYKLHKELATRNGGVAQCPYTGKTISPHDALGRNSAFQIEHIVPRSISNNDSFANKTLCDASVNRLKGNRTPWEYFEATKGDKDIWGVDTWEEVCNRVRRLLPDNKYKLFTSKKTRAELSEGFTSSQLVDTAYMSKKAKEYLTSICDKNSVINIPGAVTAELRKLWGLNSILDKSISLPPHHIEQITFPEDTDRIPVSILIDKKSEEVVRVYPKFTPTPTREVGDFLASVEKKSKKLFWGRHEFIFPQDYYSHLADGRYYLLVRSPQVIGFQEQFNYFPISREDELIVNVEINDKGKITSSTDINIKILEKCDAPKEAGRYWVRIPVQDDWKIEPATKAIKLKPQSISCNGYIKDGKLRAKPFYTQEDINGEETKNVQVIVTPIIEEATFVKKKREAPAISNHEFVITGTIIGSLFTSDEDISFVTRSEGSDGRKHYCTLSFDGDHVVWFPYQNTIPEIDTKEEEMIEGELEYYKDELSFSPKKNRDDHRHHALDAIVIAMASRSQYQKLSTYNALRDDAARGNAERPRFEQPWNSFRCDVEQSVASVLVNHKKKNKVVNKVQKRIRKNGRIYESTGLAVRGQLSDTTIYGKRRAPISNQTAMHKRIPIENVTTRSHVNSVVDDTIRGLMHKRLIELGVNISEIYTIPAGAFVDNGAYQIFLPNKNGDPVPVKKVRLKDNISQPVQLGNINQYVKPNNNDHFLVYRNHDGKIVDKGFTFWEVASRVSNGEEAIQKPDDCEEVLLLLRKNELFVLGLSLKELEKAIEDKDNQLISKHLYRVQIITANDYKFRLHTASTLKNPDEEIRVRLSSLIKLTPINVELDNKGEVMIK